MRIGAPGVVHQRQSVSGGVYSEKPPGSRSEIVPKGFDRFELGDSQIYDPHVGQTHFASGENSGQEIEVLVRQKSMFRFLYQDQDLALKIAQHGRRKGCCDRPGSLTSGVDQVFFIPGLSQGGTQLDFIEIHGIGKLILMGVRFFRLFALSNVVQYGRCFRYFGHPS